MKLGRSKEILMIPRYTRPEMGRIWTDQRKFETWLEIELLACEALAELGQIPGCRERNSREASFDVQRVSEIEKEEQMCAFLTSVRK
jgi:adenylosuccinate lyase